MKQNLRDKHAQATRTAILKAATTLFARKGYYRTSLDEIADKAGATKGAVYHHFSDKARLFQEVLEARLQIIARVVFTEISGQKSAKRRIEKGVDAFLTAAAEPISQRIVFQEAPQVLGVDRCREIDAQYFLPALNELVAETVDETLMRSVGREILTEFVFGAMIEASLILGRSDDPSDTSTRLRILLLKLLSAFQ